MRPGRLGLSLIVFALWMAVMALPGLFLPREKMTLFEAVSQSLLIGPPLAALFLIICCRMAGWTDIGLTRPSPDFRLRLLWLPAIYMAVFAASATALGLPPVATIGIVLINVCFASLSEELMFRGVLLQGLRSRMRIWPAILISTLVFGAVHVLNALSTGDVGKAMMQAVGAGAVGFLFVAIRLRSASLYPGIALHAVWNLSVVLLALAIQPYQTGPEPEGALAVQAMFIAAAVFLPVPLYGLYLLRHAERMPD